MSVADLYNFNVDDRPSVLRWSFANQAEHFKIQTAIFKKFNLNLPLFPIDPVPLGDLATWARAHQSMHSSANGLLGLFSNDLTSIDIRKPEQVEVFAYLHAQEHFRFQQALGLT